MAAKVCSGLLIVAALLLGSFAPSRAAPSPRYITQALPPVVIEDGTFLPFTWSATAELSSGASFSVTQQASGGNPDAFRFMSHRLPPVTGEALASVVVTHLKLTERYLPFSGGEIRAIDYIEDGIILSFPFADAFSTTQPVIEQDGRLFRATQFLRFVAQNSSHDWETKSLNQLTAQDFVAVDGSGDHPDFQVSGGMMRFGFTRSNSRGSTQPPVPSDQDMVVDQGVDNWRVIIYRDDTDRPPNAVDDTFILDGDRRSLPLLEFFDVAGNDGDPNLDRLEVVEVTEPLFGSVGIFSQQTVVYQLEEPRASDLFRYTISDGSLTSSAQVQVYIDCACTVLCLSNLELPEPPGFAPTQVDTQTDEEIDLPLIYGVRDQVLKPTLDGRRYVEMYYTTNPEILVKTFTTQPLRVAALEGVLLWQEPLRSLVKGDGRAAITQAQVDALQSYLDQLAGVSSPELQQRIAAELDRLGPLDTYVGMAIQDAKRRVIGDPTVYLPLIRLAP